MPVLAVLVLLLLAGDLPSNHVRATVWIRAGDRSVGTGWIVDADRRWVVTARHVIGDRDSVDVHFLDTVFHHSLPDRAHYIADRADLYRRGLVATGRVLARRDQADLALLVLDRMPTGVPALRLSPTGAAVGDGSQSIGHRHDADRMWNLTTGHVRQLGTLTDGYFWAGHRVGAGVRLLLLQAPVEGGESGAAVVNDAGDVIGLVSAVVGQAPGLAIGIDVSEIRALISEVRKAPPEPAPRANPSAHIEALARATVWVRPRVTDGRAAGALIDLDRKLVLTSMAAVGREAVVDVVAPRWDNGRVVAEADAYRDLLGLRLAGRCVSGMVLARDPVRDLALIELDEVPDAMAALEIAGSGPRMGDRVAAISHPTGIDLLWLFAAGTVRSVGDVQLAPEGLAERSKAWAGLFQLPHQGSASGGPIVNDKSALIGVLAAREAARQDLAYAVTPAEIQTFLAGARPLWRPESSNDWDRRGLYAAQRGRPAVALEAFEAGARLDPADARFQVHRAWALLRLGRRDEAARVTDAAAPKTKDAATLADLAAVFADLGYPGRAADLVGRALKKDPRCAAAYVVRARLRSGREAEADVAEALFLDPDCAASYGVRAALRDRTTAAGRREAVADWSRLLELVPIDTDALRERAALSAALQEPKKAVADWARLTELEPLTPGHWHGLARSRFAAGDRSGAVDSLESAARVRPDQAVAVFRIVRELGRELEADNPADRARVSEWYSTAMTRLALWLPIRYEPE
jgi:S1-C subfamily serine protease/Flp pilus assembly protein TadD